VKNYGKFTTNCWPVESKHRNIAGNLIPLIFVVAICWLIPTEIKYGTMVAFERIQAPIYASVAALEDLEAGIGAKIISRSELVNLCRDLVRQNLFLRATMLNSTGQPVDSNHDIETGNIGNFMPRPARVIRRDITAWMNELTIDIGAQHGITAGMGVISKNCVVGRVKSVSQKTSTVELLTSPQFRIAVHATGDPMNHPIIFSGNERSVSGKAIGVATNIPSSVCQGNVEVVLVTSELSGIFPKNIVVGTVTVTDPAEEYYFSADVTLDDELLSKLYEVAVLVNIEGQ
jgi:rod shape-determining protein MreC